MSKITYQVIHDKFRAFILILVGIIMGLLLFSFIESFFNPIIIKNKNNNITVEAGKSFRLCREVEYIRDTSVTLGRSLTRVDSNSDIEDNIISFNNIKMYREKGRKTRCRNIYIPDSTPAGKWLFHTYMEVHTLPFWSHTFEAPIVNLTIIRKDK